MGRPSHHPSLLCEEPELTRKLDQPAEYPGRLPFPWPVEMHGLMRDYLQRHDGQWVSWYQTEGYNVWQAEAGDHDVMIIIADDGGPFDVDLTSFGETTILSRETGQETPVSQEGWPELQALLKVMAGLMPGGPGRGR